VRIDVITIFPGLIAAALSESIPGIAQQRGALELVAHDLRDWALPGVHRQVDDAPYGGGAGMVLRPEPFFDALDDIRPLSDAEPYVVMLTPQGRRLDQELAAELASRERLVLLCGRYEGFDERIRTLADVEVSIGDYVTSGGEIPAMVVIDTVARLLPGVLGDDASAEDDSFATGLLEYPHYTRPASFRGMDVPDVLVSGDHARIAAWRREQSVKRTAEVRPDLLAAQTDPVAEEAAVGDDREERP
jgi:tRNA (guanine37-N1)-methyltransferase